MFFSVYVLPRGLGSTEFLRFKLGTIGVQNQNRIYLVYVTQLTLKIFHSPSNLKKVSNTFLVKYWYISRSHTSLVRYW